MNANDLTQSLGSGLVPCCPVALLPWCVHTRLQVCLLEARAAVLSEPASSHICSLCHDVPSKQQQQQQQRSFSVVAAE
jgi:hypothetical protein